MIVQLTEKTMEMDEEKERMGKRA